jgi:hypothetical protein
LRQVERQAEEQETEHAQIRRQWQRKIEDQKDMINKVIDMQTNLEFKIAEAKKHKRQNMVEHAKNEQIKQLT